MKGSGADRRMRANMAAGYGRGKTGGLRPMADARIGGGGCKDGLAGNQRSGSRMRGVRCRGRAWRALVVALATCAAVSAMTSAAAPQGAREAWPATESGHRSALILGPGTRFPVARHITIGLDKSMLVELPVDMKDVA